VKLPRAFFGRATLDVASDLIGKVFVHNRRGVRTSGVIVEVEAYIGESDPACHAAPGRTPRNAPLYGPPGFSYVYLNYGIHCLVNVVTEEEGSPAAVLIRALEPLEGLSVMRRRRARANSIHTYRSCSIARSCARSRKTRHSGTRQRPICVGRWSREVMRWRRAHVRVGGGFSAARRR